MKVVVVDASALVEYLLRTAAASAIEPMLRSAEADLHVPALVDVEVAAALRGAIARGSLQEARASQALQDHLHLPLPRHGHEGPSSSSPATPGVGGHHVGGDGRPWPRDGGGRWHPTP